MSKCIFYDHWSVAVSTVIVYVPIFAIAKWPGYSAGGYSLSLRCKAVGTTQEPVWLFNFEQ